ncbi:MAG: hypothetical protein ABI811_18400 [Acidobacteriota bacterium]
MTGITIRGDGIAAACCSHILTQAGIATSWDRLDRSRLPVIMLSGAALTLMGDVFGPMQGFSQLHRIRRRVVSWGPDSKPVTMAHAAVVVSEQFLLHAVATKLAQNRGNPPQMQGASQWEILTATPLPPATQEHNFGLRRATAIAVTLRDRADSSACWVESVKDGWLFLIPNGTKSGYLLAVGDSPENLLDASSLIAKRIEQLGERAGEFPANPRLHWPLCGPGPLSGPGWLACGSAAMAFDPLCGDGTAHAIREAILASAVIQAIAKGTDPGPLLSHYQARLTAGLSRHLTLCEEFYRTGSEGDWWKREWRSMQQGAAWCAGKVGDFPAFRYQLNGFELHPV